MNRPSIPFNSDSLMMNFAIADDFVSDLMDDNVINECGGFVILDDEGEIVQVFDSYEDAEDWIAEDVELYRIVNNNYSY